MRIRVGLCVLLIAFLASGRSAASSESGATPVATQIAKAECGSSVVLGQISTNQGVVRVKVFNPDGKMAQKSDAVVDPDSKDFVAGLRSALVSGQIVQTYFLDGSNETNPSSPVAIQASTGTCNLAANQISPTPSDIKQKPEPQNPQASASNKDDPPSWLKVKAPGSVTLESNSVTTLSVQLLSNIQSDQTLNITCSLTPADAGVSCATSPSSVTLKNGKTQTLVVRIVGSENALGDTEEKKDFTLTLQATQPDNADPQILTAVVHVVKSIGDLTRMIVGFDQAGASSASSTQKFLFDFFTERPLGNLHGSTPPYISSFKWWGNVQIGSQPIQITGAPSAPALTQAVKALHVNTLAQSGEFATGLEYDPSFLKGGLHHPFLFHDREYNTLGFLIGVGATIPFNVQSSATVYDLPASGPQRDAFDHAYPTVSAACNLQVDSTGKSSPCKQVAFVPPDRHQFYRQWMAGVRWTALYSDDAADESNMRSLGTVTFTVGQNELITGGGLHGMVAQIDGFYPFPPLPISVGQSKLDGFYIFGRAQFALSKVMQSTPISLNQTSPQPTDLSLVPTIAQPNRRDLYSVGLGVDAVRFLRYLFKEQ